MPQFLKREMRVLPFGGYVLQNPEAVTILPNLSIGESYLFDTTHAIIAKICDKNFTQLFLGGPADSTLTIARSDEDTIILSKNYGVLRWGGFRQEGLAGPDGKLGKWVPAFKDIYNFEVGDMFEHRSVNNLEYYYDTVSQTYLAKTFYYHRKYSIIDKYVNGDTIRYHFQGLTYSHYNYQPQSSWGVYDKTVTYVDSATHSLNYHKGQIYPIDNCAGKPCYDTLFVKYSNTHQRVIKTNDTGDFSSLVDYLPDSLSLFGGTYSYMCNAVIDGPVCGDPVYAACLGQIQSETVAWNGCISETLIAYSTSQCGSWGTFTEDSVITAAAKRIDTPRVKIYPNPVTDRLRVQTDGLRSGTSTIFDATGKALLRQAFSTTETEFNVTDLPSGVYSLLLIDENERFYSARFIKK